MKKEYILKSNIEFNDVIKKGKKYKNNEFVIYFLPNFDLKIGITIGKKMGKAHIRNYHKRVIRSLCRENLENLLVGKYVIIGRENIKKISYEKKQKSFKILTERIKNEEKKS